MEEFNPFSLSGKTVLVTGASSGIGQAIAISISKMGATVVINGRNIAKLENTLSQMVGVSNSIIAADITKEEDIASLSDTVPQLDGIVHCAGIGHRMPAKMLTANDIDTVMRPTSMVQSCCKRHCFKKRKCIRTLLLCSLHLKLRIIQARVMRFTVPQRER